MKPDWRLVMSDVTHYWVLGDGDQEKVERIVTVYLYNKNEVTHCCEITPSYCLWPVETRAEFRDGVSDLDIDRIDGNIRRWADDEVVYVHCHALAGMTVKHKKLGSVFPGSVETGDEQRESLLEYLRGNQRL